MTAIDVCGHEITHGMTSKTANLAYQRESGALNEGFSDIFGNTIEKWARPNQASWTLGEDFSYVIRNMANLMPIVSRILIWVLTGKPTTTSGCAYS